MYRWIKNILTDRTIATQIEGVTSTKECLGESCTLFTQYINVIVKFLPDTHQPYIDDHVLWTTSANIYSAQANVNTSIVSALNAVEQAGYCLTIQYPNATRKDISLACGQHCNNYDAELKAIRSALQTISNDCDNPNPPCMNNIVIFTDSQSEIQAIAQMLHHKLPI